MMRYIILNLNTEVSWTKKHIDHGQYSRDEIELASCIRSTFLLSHNIRKDTVMTIKPTGLDYEITLFGDELRYLDASERGILLLLGRAFSKSVISKTNRMTPGIERNTKDHWRTMATPSTTTFWYPSQSQKTEKPHSNSNNIFLVDSDTVVPPKEMLRKCENLQPFQLPTLQLQPSSAILAFHQYLDREIK